ncbi:MAG: VOC family protein [Acidobacteriota bacterium]
MRVKRLGHVVLRVRELERSVRFYGEVLGLREVARYGGRMAFFSLGENHHDLALQEVGAGAPSPHPRSVGLYHVAFKVGDSIEELRAWRDRLESHGVPILGASDHRVSQALYVTDPDGIEIELYVDADPAVWRNDPSAVATIEPIDL